MRWSGSLTVSTSRSPFAAPAHGTTTHGARARDRPPDCCATWARPPMARGRSMCTRATWSPRVPSRRCCLACSTRTEPIDPVHAMPEPLVVDLAIDVHADLLRDANRSAVLGAHQRDHVVQVEVRERPVASGDGRLGRDPFSLATGSRVPSDLDLVDLLDDLERWPRGAEERAGRSVFDDPQGVAACAVRGDLAIEPRTGGLPVERCRIPHHVLRIREHRVEVVEVVGTIGPQEESLGLEPEILVHPADPTGA